MDSLYSSTRRSLFNDAHSCYCSHWIRLLLIKEINIPGIEIQWAILIGDKLITCLPWNKNVTLCTLIIESADLTLLINPEVIIRILQDECLIISVCSAPCRQ